MAKVSDETNRLPDGCYLLSTESRDEFLKLRDDVYAEFQPDGPIEQMFVNDVVALTWEIMRVRRLKAGLINGALRTALEKVIAQILPYEDFENGLGRDRAATELAHQWFTSDAVKATVAELLATYQLDLTTIEAQAYCQCAEALEGLDRWLMMLMARWDKALLGLATYRQSMAKLLRRRTEEILEHEEVPMLVGRYKRGQNGEYEADCSE
jgi:hypothetical protein